MQTILYNVAIIISTLDLNQLVSNFVKSLYFHKENKNDIKIEFYAMSWKRLSNEIFNGICVNVE